MANLTPAGWLTALEPRLDRQAKAVQVYRDYRDGNHKISHATQKFREAFSRYFPPMANNWMDLVCSASVERLEITGFRFGNSEAADQAAWELWQASNMDAESIVAHDEAVTCGRCPVLIDPNGGDPFFVVESASECIVATAPGRRNVRLAALKRWWDEYDGYWYANVYLPTTVHKFRSSKPHKQNSGGARVQWTDRPGSGLHGVDVVPIVELANNPNLTQGGTSDLDVAMPIQDRINKFCLDMDVSSEFNAYPQRYAAGWEVPTVANPNNPNGQPVVDPNFELRASQGRWLVSKDSETKFGQLDPGNVEQYVKPIEMYVRHLGAQTQVPAHYLLGDMVNISGDALKAAEEGLTAKCRRKTIDFSDSWEEAMRIAFKAKGETEKAADKTAEVRWRDPEARTLAQVVDAAVKMREGLNLPYEECWRMIGLSEEQIRRGLKQRGMTPGGVAHAAPEQEPPAQTS